MQIERKISEGLMKKFAFLNVKHRQKFQYTMNSEIHLKRWTGGNTKKYTANTKSAATTTKGCKFSTFTALSSLAVAINYFVLPIQLKNISSISNYINYKIEKKALRKLMQIHPLLNHRTRCYHYHLLNYVNHIC